MNYFEAEFNKVELLINNGKFELDVLKKIKCDNIDEIIEFSYSDKMENNLWRTV